MKILINYISKENIGLLLSVSGSILIALSVGEPNIAKNGGFTFGEGPMMEGIALKEFTLIAITYPRLFYLGIILLIIGFILQIKKK